MGEEEGGALTDCLSGSGFGDTDKFMDKLTGEL